MLRPERPQLVARGRQGDTVVKHVVEEPGVPFVIRGLGIGEVPHRTLGEELAEERPRPADADRERPGRERRSESRRQRLGRAFEPGIRVEATSEVEGRDPGRDRDRVPAERPGLVHGPGGRESLHQRFADRATRGQRRVDVDAGPEPGTPHLNDARADQLRQRVVQVITELARGVYTIGATKANYLPQNRGEKRPIGPGVPIELADGQVVENVTLPWRASDAWLWLKLWAVLLAAEAADIVEAWRDQMDPDLVILIDEADWFVRVTV